MAGKSSHHHFENNPFFIAASGITLLANLAQSLFVLFIVLSILSLFGNSFTPYPTDLSFGDLTSTIQGWTLGDWAVAGGSGFIVLLAAALITALFGGVSSYTSAKLARGKSVRFTIAFHEAFENLWAYLWLQIIIFVKILLWTLLFIVPGVIMAVRYSLAGVAFYDEKKNLRGNAAIKESLRLTKDGWITTYAANTLFNIITLGAITSIVSTGVNALLYRQFEQTGNKKPPAHWLSWLTLILPFALLIAAIFFTVVLAIIVGLLGHKAL